MAVAGRNHGADATTGHVVAESASDSGSACSPISITKASGSNPAACVPAGSTDGAPNFTPILSGCANYATAPPTTNPIFPRNLTTDHELVLDITK
jgi:hypothetical protein